MFFVVLSLYVQILYNEIKIMKFRKSIITDNGLVIDPDDDVDIVYHTNFNEFIYDGYSIYCNTIYQYHYD